VEVLVADCSGLTLEQAIKELPRADVFGYSCTSLDYPMMNSLRNRLMLRFPKATHIIGGPHVTAMPTSTLLDGFDVAFVREAEKSILDFVDDYERGTLKEVYEPQEMLDLPWLPRPDRAALDWTGGRVLANSKDDKSVNIMASRGCPFDCAFCASQVMWTRKVRWREPSDVVAEMQECVDALGTEVFRFSDDNMTTSKQWTEEFCALVKPLGIQWRLSFRVDSITPQLLATMREAGCVEAGLGIESFDPNVLKVMHKRVKPENSINAVKMLHEAGMGARVLLMIGTPGETHLKTVEHNVRALEEIRGQYVYVTMTMFTPLPGCGVWMFPNKYGVKILSKDFSEYNLCFVRREVDGSVSRTINPLISIDGMTREQQIDNAEQMLEYLETIPEYWKGREEAKPSED